LKHWDRKKDAAATGDLKEFYDMVSSFLSLEASPAAALVQEKLQGVLKSGQQELVILALLGCSEILTRLQDQEGAEYLRRRAFEWLESLYRGLPEEMQLSFEHREDFKRLAEARLQKLKATGISRDRFLTFAKINKRMSEESQMESVLQQVMDAAMALAGAERGFLLIRDEESESPIISGYRVETARNMKKENIGTDEFKISLSVVEEALRRRVAILTDDAQADPNFQNAESVHLYQLKSILVLPLVGEAGCIGALYLDHRFEVGAFSEEGLLFLKTFADQAVLAIEKAKTLTALSQAKAALENRVEEQALQIEQMEVQLKEARQGLRFGYEEIIGHSPKMIKILQLLDRVTDTQVPVWIHGESGTGKELIARALHYNSDRKEHPFITENCSAIPENLLESVLFGHVKGAFTHAERDKMGLFEAANGGTIFLDEIGDMPLAMQSKLLRVLQEGEIRRVGSNESKPIDVRVVSATNKDLPRLVKEGKFREDLFFRLNGMKIDLPALRNRREDLPPLVQHFIQKVAGENNLQPCGITEEALKAMAQYDWPGNIRELENTVRNAVLFSDGQTITRDTLGFKPELFEAPKPRPKEEEEAVSPEQKEKREVDAQREAILDALVRASFHKGQAAKDLG
ncbi:MAG: sigma-54-dependent Fis family transcriptional regulator, partial [bacterium]|nr:sigma-54-dependent Fis family transcriptional regulator [bacterium]